MPRTSGQHARHQSVGAVAGQVLTSKGENPGGGSEIDMGCPDANETAPPPKLQRLEESQKQVPRARVAKMEPTTPMKGDEARWTP